jgi:hypothetical protein
MKDLPSMFPFDGDAYDRRRAELARTLANMLMRAGIEPCGLTIGAEAATQAVAA